MNPLCDNYNYNSIISLLREGYSPNIPCNMEGYDSDTVLSMMVYHEGQAPKEQQSPQAVDPQDVQAFELRTGGRVAWIQT
jgi:hypothetical protein